MTRYPEHEKLQAVRDESQAIGEFLDYGGYELGEWVEGHGVYRKGEFVPVREPINDILAKYFGLNPKVLEQEKQQMLQELRAAQEVSA